MKNSILSIIILFAFSCTSQKKVKSDTISEMITQKMSNKKGTQLVIKKVYDDSRCPQGVNCIWAGEVFANVEVYEDKKLIEEKTIIFNSKSSKENILWFSKFFPTKKIKSLEIFPYLKDGETIKPEDYYIKVGFVN